MKQQSRPRPVVLCILDGWGHREACEDNAICQARTPVLDRLAATCPRGLIDASAQEVGLPPNQMGNSEVGHMNLGAGRIVTQDLPRIDAAIETGELARNPALLRFIGKLQASGGTAHIMGLMSPGGVHAHQDHIAYLANAIGAAGVPVLLHAFLDGRDTPPRSALDYIEEFQAAAPSAPVATVIGRYYAMDRDQRWERVARAYEALVDAKGAPAPDARGAIEQSYAGDTNDEFVTPSIIGAYAGMAEGDGLLMANFRADRARHILSALLDPAFDDFTRARTVGFAAAAGMADYGAALAPFLDTLFEPLDLTQTLGEVVASAGLKQLRIAETEKYAHVTFFLNGGRETEFTGEERILIPSPKVATYDLKPEMSAPEVTERLVAAIGEDRFDLIVVNYANGDMVGHSGNLEAAIKAVEAVDHCLSRLSEAVTEAGGALIITADHGNAEQMADIATGQAHTAHTMNKVPVILVNAPSSAGALANGRLADIAPTLLDLMGLSKPTEMTGQSLIRPAAAQKRAAGEKGAGLKSAMTAFAILCGAFALAVPAPAQAQTDRIKALERALQEDQARAQELEQQAEEIAKEIQALQADSIAAARQTQLYEAQISAIETRLAALEQKAADKTADLRARRAQLGGTLAALQRIALQPVDALLVSPGSPIDTVRSAMLLKVAIPAIEQRSQALRGELDNLAALHQRIALERGEMNEMNQALVTERSRLGALITRKRAARTATAAERKSAEMRAARLASEAKDLRDLLDRVGREAQEQAERTEQGSQERVERERLASDQVAREAARAAQEAEAEAKKDNVPEQPAKDQTAKDQTASLALAKPNNIRPFPSTPASLVMPAQGRVVIRYGQTGGSNGTSKGVTIQTRLGAQVVAPFDGRVVYAGLFRRYGQILIIEHGGRYHTLLAGLDRIDAVVGQWLLAGEPVGTLGASGDGNPELYLELRRAGQPVNPLPWLATTGDKVRG